MRSESGTTDLEKRWKSGINSGIDGLMTENQKPDRYLQKRIDGGYRYVRRVPVDALMKIHEFEPDHPKYVRRSLDTRSLDTARAKRDAMEIADDDYWRSVVVGELLERDAYERALARAKALRIEYRTASDLAQNASLEEILKRFNMSSHPTDYATVDAALGAAGEPTITLDEAFVIFEERIRAAEQAKKSELQRRKWRELKLSGIRNFKEVVGDIPIEKITREHAIAFYEYWLDRFLPKEKGVKPISGSRANKDMGTMRALYGEYMHYVGQHELAAKNPFAGLSFEREDDSRPPFSEKWIVKKILADGALYELNDEARLAVLAMINTGARPSEIINLTSDQIFIDAPHPYIDIRTATDRRLKTRSSVRKIPLVGVSLDA